MARVPVQAVSSDDRRALADLDVELKRVIFGQESAIEEVASAIKLSRSGLRAPDKPIGNFLFAGPTGVGKTELARQLARMLGVEFLRYDMSEYMEKHAVSRLIGAPPGYVGYEEGGQLTEAVRRRPYAVVLLDEIEKAHPDVFNTLLQLMDDGRLTDGQGRTVSFANTVLIMTSNVGSDRIVGESVDEKIREGIEEVLAATFKPEVLNRIDDSVIFHRLSTSDLGRIVELQDEQLAGRLRERGIDIELSDDARTLLGNLGYDPTYGARPLKRVIQKQLVDKLALRILEGEFAEGDTVEVDAKKGELTFAKGAPRVTEAESEKAAA
jgi:ATP-dependent Clp protease ATP-binding subunit ClpB